MNHKILLIEPPFYRLFKDNYSLDRYPLSLGYLSGTIKKNTNWDVQAYIADYNTDKVVTEPAKISYLASAGFNNYQGNLKDLSKPIWREVKTAIAEYDPSVIGISANCPNFTSACIVAGLAKSHNKGIITVTGGPHPSAVGPEALRCPDIDIAVRGEGEQTVVELLNAIEKKNDFSAIAGVVYRKNGTVIENAPRNPIENLDSLPFPYESAPQVLRDFNKYPIHMFKRIFSSRGCPYNCFFCGSRDIWGRKVRFRSVKNIIKEIKYLQDRGLNYVSFEDDIFGIRADYLLDLCDAIMTDCPGLKWGCEMHVKLVNEKTVFAMKRAGCNLISIGIESGNNYILKKIRKNITVKEALAACRIIKKAGLFLRTFFIYGFPWETAGTLNDTLSVMLKTKSDFVVYGIFTPHPGTEPFRYCRENNIIKDNYDISIYYHQSSANHFCANVKYKKFRKILSRIERIVDAGNFKDGKAPLLRVREILRTVSRTGSSILRRGK